MRVDLKKTLFILPNLFTLSSIFCGFFAMIECVNGASPEAFHRAALLIMFAAFFDTIDGRVARLTKTQSAFGVQIDSLADVVSFGAAPSLLVYQWSLHRLGTVGLFGSFLILAAGAIRLARFNVLAMSASGAPKKPSRFIIGLPIPGAAGIIVSLVAANYALDMGVEHRPELILAMAITLAFFMVSTIKFRSFKDVKWGTRSAILLFTVLGATTAIAVLVHPTLSLFCLPAAYVALAVGEAVVDMSRRAAGKPSRLIERDDER